MTTTKGPNGLRSLTTQVVDPGSTATNVDSFIGSRFEAEGFGANLTHWLVSPETALGLSLLKRQSGSNESLIDIVQDGLQVAGLPVLVSPYVDTATSAWGVDSTQIRFVQRTGTTVERFPSVTNDGQYVRAISRVGFGFLNPAGIVRIYNASGNPFGGTIGCPTP